MKKIVIATKNTKTGEVKVQERLFTNDMTTLIMEENSEFSKADEFVEYLKRCYNYTGIIKWERHSNNSEIIRFLTA